MPPALSADECRVLGVLVEKAQTTPAQYPLTLNAIVTGANQKNNRHPVVEMDEERAFNAIDSLRTRRFVNEVQLTGSRVPKFRHVAREALEVDTAQLVLLADLLLRGPQSPGELRSNASRMHAFESLEAVESQLRALGSRPDPLVRELGRVPGERAVRWTHLLGPSVAPGAETHRHAESGAPPPQRADDLIARVARLEAEVATIRAVLDSLRSPSEGPAQPARHT